MADGHAVPARGWVPVRGVGGNVSIWPAPRPLPAGWQPCGEATDRAGALDAAVAVRVAQPAAATPEPDDRQPVSVERRFASVASRFPERVAIVEGETTLTYAELAVRAERARAGLERLGARRGSTVGVCMTRGGDMVAVLLGILATGAAYVPLDGRHPPARLAFMARDADVACVVGEPDATERLSGVEAPVADIAALYDGGDEDDGPALETASAIDGLAYLMFTSGSTGKPKAVEVTHRNLSSFLDAMSALLPPTASRRVLFSTRLGFDIAGLEIFLPLTTGGTCIVAPETWLSHPRALASLVNSAEPSLVQATPAQWRLLLEAGARFAGEQHLLCGGEALGSTLAAALAELPAPAFNLYGPTEASIWATAWPIDSAPAAIGQALAHARVYVLDEQLEPVAEGAEGEAYIGGPAVARGYRDQPRLTAERFVPDPWATEAGARMYATGDVVRSTAGRLEFLGRRDTQVKINGNRVELGEIECVAEQVDGVRASVAVVAADATEAAVLTLYVEAHEHGREIAERLDEHLRSALPPVMVPRRIHVLDALPLTVNGKVDVLKLAAAPTDAGSQPVAEAGAR